MQKLLGRPVKEALSSLPADEVTVVETAAPRKETRQEGTLRVIACREGTLIAARFKDGLPRQKGDA